MVVVSSIETGFKTLTQTYYNAYTVASLLIETWYNFKILEQLATIEEKDQVMLQQKLNDLERIKEELKNTDNPVKTYLDRKNVIDELRKDINDQV